MNRRHERDFHRIANWGRDRGMRRALGNLMAIASELVLYLAISGVLVASVYYVDKIPH